MSEAIPRPPDALAFDADCEPLSVRCAPLIPPHPYPATQDAQCRYLEALVRELDRRWKAYAALVDACEGAERLYELGAFHGYYAEPDDEMRTAHNRQRDEALGVFRAALALGKGDKP